VLSDAVEELYRAFRDVPLDPDVSYCDHCLGPDDVAELRVTPLRELGADAIHRLVANAPVGTLGDMTYFRHFLPRVVELAVRGEVWASMIEIGVEKAFKESDPPQRAAILAVLEAWWSDILSTWPSATSADDLIAIVDCCELPLRPYFDAWSAHGTTTAAHHLADYVGALVFSDSTAERDAWLASGAASALIRAVPPHIDFDRALGVFEALESEARGPASP
jgi:hypothetical protein